MNRLRFLNSKIRKEDFSISNSKDSNNTSLIYGEVFNDDLLKIINKFKCNESSMLDVGSGCGKLVIYIALKSDMYVEGIEIDENRYLQSEKLLDYYNLYEKVSFINEDFSSLYFGEYDIVYCCNLVFSEEDNNKLFEKLKNEFTGLFILFEYNRILEQYLISKTKVKCSWNDSTEIFIFKK